MKVAYNIAEIVVVVPLPPVDCKPNTHKHWRAKSKAIKQAREEAFNVGMEARLKHGQLCGRVRIHHTWYMAADPLEGAKGHPKRYRPLDEGNAIAALKGTVDGLVDSGLLQGDSHNLLVWGDGRLRRNSKEHLGLAQVVLRLEVMEAGSGA